MEIAFSEGKNIIDFCVNSQISLVGDWIPNIASKFLYTKIGSRNMPESIKEMSSDSIRQHLLDQRILSLTNNGTVRRYGLDSYLGAAAYKRHCAAPINQIKEAVYIVCSTFYHFYPLLEKRQRDLQLKENY